MEFQGEQYTCGNALPTAKNARSRFERLVGNVFHERSISPCTRYNFRARRRSKKRMRILKGLSSRRLPCGCVVGIYETYGAEIVTLVDSRDEACDRREHAPGHQVTFDDPPPDAQEEGPSFGGT